MAPLHNLTPACIVHSLVCTW